MALMNRLSVISPGISAHLSINFICNVSKNN